MTDFDRFVEARWVHLVRTARMLGCSETEAEDLVQQTLVHLHGRWNKVAAAEQPEAYVYRSLVNAFRRSRRRRWRGEVPTVEPLTYAGVSSDGTDDIVRTMDLRAALQRLSPMHREVLVLRFAQDLSVSAVAEILNVSEGTVKSRASRALAELRKTLSFEGTLL